MALALRTTLRAGVARVCTRNGAVLIGAFLFISLLQAGFVWVISTTYVPLGSNTQVISSPAAGSTPGTSLPSLVAIPSVLLASVTGGVLTIPVQVVTIRTMVSRHTDRIPEEFVFHNMGWATLHSFLGSWLVSALTTCAALVCLVPGLIILFVVSPSTQWLLGSWTGRIGLGLFVLVLLLPSAFLGVSLIFVGQEIAIKDRGLIRAITGSWRQCRGSRLRLLSLALLPILVQAGITMPVFHQFDPLLAQGITVAETAVVQITIAAVMARAYVAVHSDTITPIAGS